MTGCPTCGGFGDRHDPIAHDECPLCGRQWRVCSCCDSCGTTYEDCHCEEDDE